MEAEIFGESRRNAVYFVNELRLVENRREPRRGGLGERGCFGTLDLRLGDHDETNQLPFYRDAG